MMPNRGLKMRPLKSVSNGYGYGGQSYNHLYVAFTVIYWNSKVVVRGWGTVFLMREQLSVVCR